MISFATKTLKVWVDEQEMIGHWTFSYDEALAALSRFSNAALSSELNRLVTAGRIACVHRGFYVIIPVRYRRAGVVPPQYFVDDLFKYLGKPYYIGLLSAAMIHGAAHQMPQIDFVMTVPPRMTLSKKRNLTLRWIYRASIPEAFILTRHGENGAVRYSSAELTALDLVQYVQHVGGLSSVATVLAELCEAMSPEKLTAELVGEFKVATVQRLGYLLEDVLAERELADALFAASRKKGVRFQPILLRSTSKESVRTKAARWNISVNDTVEVDDL